LTNRGRKKKLTTRGRGKKAAFLYGVSMPVPLAGMLLVDGQKQWSRRSVQERRIAGLRLVARVHCWCDGQ